MDTIELISYRHGMYEYFWSLEEYSNSDELWEIERKSFIIPEGFSLGEYVNGKLGIFDKEGHEWEIKTNCKTNQPYLIGLYKIYLKSADLIFSTIKDLRRATGLTQKEFSEYFGISKRTIECWERGQSIPADYLVKLMEYKLRGEGLLAGEIEENQK